MVVLTPHRPYAAPVGLRVPAQAARNGSRAKPASERAGSARAHGQPRQDREREPRSILVLHLDCCCRCMRRNLSGWSATRSPTGQARSEFVRTERTLPRLETIGDALT